MNAQGVNPWTVTIIDYYGPGCICPGGSKNQLAIIPEQFEYQNDSNKIKHMRLRYVNLD